MHRLAILIALAVTGAVVVTPAAQGSTASNAQELESIVAGNAVAGSVMPIASSAGTIRAPLPGTPDPSGLGQQNKGTSPGSNDGRKVGSLRRAAPKPKIRCLVNGSSGPMTCTYYRSGKAYKRCRFRTRKLRNGACRTLARRSADIAGGPVARSASISWQGFPNTALSQVGKLFAIDGGQWVSQCTGTLISPTLVLTAGHCVFDKANGKYHDGLYFVPGGSYNGLAGAVKMNEPYGVWKGYAWWTTDSYESSGSSGLDWGLIELQPEDGVFPGQQLGSFQAFYGLSWAPSTRVYEVGYPASGIWRTSSYLEGRSQYACDTTFDSYSALPGGYGLHSLCSMNGGASGGPWFRYYNGKWVVAGINDLCNPKTDEREGCAPYSTQVISNFFDDRFGQFISSIYPSKLHF